MSLQTPKEWDERYGRAEYWAGTEPVGFLRNVLPLLKRGAALDIATGEGRNAVFLAQHGWHVTAIDRSAAGLEKAAALARMRGADERRLTFIQADLENYALPVGAFEVVLCCYYLQRSLFPAMAAALRQGGTLVFETYTTDQLQYREGPRCPDHLLRPGELLHAFSGLEVLFYSESNSGKGIASLLARKHS